MYATLSVSVSSVERCSSNLRHFKAWLKSTMIEEILNGHTYSKIHINVNIQPRRLSNTIHSLT